MAIRKFKPTTPGQRNKAISAFDEITAKKALQTVVGAPQEHRRKE